MLEPAPAPQTETQPVTDSPWRLDIFARSCVLLCRIRLKPVAPATSEENALWFVGVDAAVLTGVADHGAVFRGETVVSTAGCRRGRYRSDGGIWFPFLEWTTGDRVDVNLRIFNIPPGLLK